MKGYSQVVKPIGVLKNVHRINIKNMESGRMSCRACSIQWETGVCIQNFEWKSKGVEHSEEMGTDMRKTLK